MLGLYATLAILLLSAMLGLVLVAFFHLRRRHRAARHALNRLRHERDKAIWDLAQAFQGAAPLPLPGSPERNL